MSQYEMLNETSGDGRVLYRHKEDGVLYTCELRNGEWYWEAAAAPLPWEEA